MVPKTPSIPSWKFAVGNIQHNFLSLSDVTPEISHWRADVRIGGRQGITFDWRNKPPLAQSGHSRHMDVASCHSRQFYDVPVTSAFPLIADVSQNGRQVERCQQRKSRLPGFLFYEPHIGTGALSLFSSLRLLQLSGALRDSDHPVWPRASPSSRPIPRV